MTVNHMSLIQFTPNKGGESQDSRREYRNSGRRHESAVILSDGHYIDTTGAHKMSVAGGRTAVGDFKLPVYCQRKLNWNHFIIIFTYFHMGFVWEFPTGSCVQSGKFLSFPFTANVYLLTQRSDGNILRNIRSF